MIRTSIFDSPSHIETLDNSKVGVNVDELYRYTYETIGSNIDRGPIDFKIGYFGFNELPSSNYSVDDDLYIPVLVNFEIVIEEIDNINYRPAIISLTLTLPQLIALNSNLHHKWNSTYYVLGNNINSTQYMDMNIFSLIAFTDWNHYTSNIENTIKTRTDQLRKCDSYDYVHGYTQSEFIIKLSTNCETINIERWTTSNVEEIRYDLETGVLSYLYLEYNSILSGVSYDYNFLRIQKLNYTYINYNDQNFDVKYHKQWSEGFTIIDWIDRIVLILIILIIIKVIYRVTT